MITLVVPIYNMSIYLEKCMYTILNQTDTRFEAILVDDGSTDNSGALCDLYANKYPDIVRTIHKENGGLSSARNAGIDAAKGEFVIFPDPDDWLELNYVEKFITLQKQYEADLVCLGFYSEDNGVTIMENEGISSRLMNQREAQKALIISPKIKGFAWNKLYRLDIIRRNKLRFENDVGTTEDLDFAFRYLQYSSTVFFAPSTCVYHYLQREGAATHSSFNLRKIDSIKTYEKIISLTTIPELREAAESEICNTAINLMWEYLESNEEDRIVEKRIKKYIWKYSKRYLLKSQYGCGRKMQCCAVLIAPKIFYQVKKRVTRRHV